MSPSIPQPNTKRYWGDEKNLDSIYAVYLKKISYSYNNDISISASNNDINQNSQYNPRDVTDGAGQTVSRHLASDNDLTKVPESSSKRIYNSKHLSQDSNSKMVASNLRQSRYHEPREKKAGFFQKYRRRSCSVDKYSFDERKHNLSTTLENSATTKRNILANESHLDSKSKNNEASDSHSKNQTTSLIHDDASSTSSASGSVRSDSHKKSGSNRSNKIGNFLQQQALHNRKASNESAATTTSSSNINEDSPKQTQFLQWETRQIKVLQAATLDHVVKFILLVNSAKGRLGRLSANGGNSDKKSVESGKGSNHSETDEDLDSILEDERNNVAHIIHVLFCTYRIYTNAFELMLKLMDYSDLCHVEQYRFVMHYWMDNYPEDFVYSVDPADNGSTIGQTSNDLPSQPGEALLHVTGASAAPALNFKSKSQAKNPAPSNTPVVNNHSSIVSYDSSTTTRTAATTSEDSETGSVNNGSEDLSRLMSGYSTRTSSSQPMDDNQSRSISVTLVSEFIRLNRDEYLKTKALKLSDEIRASLDQVGFSRSNRNTRHYNNYQNFHDYYQQQHQGSTSDAQASPVSNLINSSRNSAVLDFDSRFIGQQLTAIDLDNFLNLKPYALLERTKFDKRIQSMIKNFNLLSRHVVVTILKSHNPHVVTTHWIAIALNLRKIKNFNSLKAIIAGLTNESIYRLKQVIWSRIDRTSLANFKAMAAIVDDVNNQSVLRQTQLIVEGTAKMSIEDDSFGTIPYMGTFLTDLTVIDARYQSYVPSPKDDTGKLKLINFEKCAKQFEILTQIQLLQKNVIASLNALQRRNHFDEQQTLNRMVKLDMSFGNSLMLKDNPAIPQVSRLFENWFYDHNVASMTDKQCHEISLTIEQSTINR